MIEYEAGRWIKKTVENALGDQITGAWLDLIPEGAALPAVRFQRQSSNDVRPINQHIVITTIKFLVVVTVTGEGATEMRNLVDLSSQLHEALHRQGGDVGNPAVARVLACTRLMPFSMTDGEGADVFRHGGGFYELVMQDLTLTL